jgi:outer membrane receptor protein involved in Fe transport
MVFSINGSIINLLDQIYITDALNGYNFDATTAQVYIAQGRRFNLGLRVSF